MDGFYHNMNSQQIINLGANKQIHQEISPLTISVNYLILICF